MTKTAWSANPWRILVVHGGIGLSWLIGDPARTAVGAFQPAIRLGRDIGLPFYPMRAWGGLLLLIAVLLAAALFRHREQAVETMCVALVAYYAFWTCAFALSAFITPHASLSGTFWALGFGWIAYDRATPHRRRRRE